MRAFLPPVSAEATCLFDPPSLPIDNMAQTQREPQAGSSTQTQTRHEEVPEPRSVGVLKLRGAPPRRRVMWEEGTVDNEGMGKKKSKICCIYHRPKAFDESSSESDSSSDGESGSDGPARPLGPGKGKGKAAGGASSSESEGGQGSGAAKPVKRKVKRHRHKHEHGPCDHGHEPSHDPSPNRYDKPPPNAKAKPRAVNETT